MKFILGLSRYLSQGRDTPRTSHEARVTPLVVSEMLTLVKLANAITRRWPDGQLKLPALGGFSVRLWLMVPFLPDENVPDALTGPFTVSLFVALG
jgi:hypothetical protein